MTGNVINLPSALLLISDVASGIGDGGNVINLPNAFNAVHYLIVEPGSLLQYPAQNLYSLNDSLSAFF